MELGDTAKYLSRFKVIPSKSLFPLEQEDFLRWLPQMKCPVCHRRLYWNLQRTIARCKSLKKDKFFIKGETLNKYLTSVR